MGGHRWVAPLLVGGSLVAILVSCASGPTSTPVVSGSPPPSGAVLPKVEPSDTAPSFAPTPILSPAGAATTAPPPTEIPSGLPAGWQHELTCRNVDGTGCQLHLYDAAGREQPGWPVALAGGCWSENLAVGADGVVYVACKIDDRLTVINSFAVTGSTRSGWPVEAEGYPEMMHVAPEGAVYIGILTGPDLRVFSIHAFGPDGIPRAGWPRTLPGVADRFVLAPDGIVAAWWYEDVREGTLDVQAARTRYTMIGPNGRTLPGLWPITSIGTATEPVVTRDGSLFYVSATGKAWGHDRTGNIIDGWPYRLSRRVPPELRPDGRLQFILGAFVNGDGTTPDSEVIVLTTAGKVASGWPYRTSASLEGVQCCVDCDATFPHATTADGTLYLAPWTKDRAEVVALDGRGRILPGWPYRLPAGSRVMGLQVRPDGQLGVTVRTTSGLDGGCNDTPERMVILAPSGEATQAVGENDGA